MVLQNRYCNMIDVNEQKIILAIHGGLKQERFEIRKLEEIKQTNVKIDSQQ